MRTDDPTPTERKLVDEIVVPLLGTAPTWLGQDLAELGANSMTVIHILAQAEELFDVEISPLDMMDNTNVAALAALIDRLCADRPAPARKAER